MGEENTKIDETTALLIRARGFIERGWCQGVSARDARGLSVCVVSEQAVEWCMTGAMIAAQESGGDAVVATERLSDAIPCKASIWSISEFNDAQETVEPVLAAFDRAIAGQGSQR